MDVISEINYKHHFDRCQQTIEKISLLHMEFWSQLSEDNPGNYFKKYVKGNNIFFIRFNENA